ncbi:hypothetical protein GCM10009612_58400 [Streptomyces beijiangensis]
MRYECHSGQREIDNTLAGDACCRKSAGPAAAALAELGRWNLGAVVLLVLWGIAYGAVPVCSQTWFSRAAPHAPEAATVLFTASFQATISAGALLGGVVAALMVVTVAYLPPRTGR